LHNSDHQKSVYNNEEFSFLYSLEIYIIGSAIIALPFFKHQI
jgi:hypothetical protein